MKVLKNLPRPKICLRYIPLQAASIIIALCHIGLFSTLLVSIIQDKQLELRYGTFPNLSQINSFYLFELNSTRDHFEKIAQSWNGFKPSEHPWYPRELEIFCLSRTWFCIINILLGWTLLEGSVKGRTRFIDCYVVVGFVQLLSTTVFGVISHFLGAYILAYSVIFVVYTYFLLCVNSFLQKLYEKSENGHSILPSFTEKV